jgi:excisionase family DNA binding protein
VDELMTVKEVALFMQVHTTTIYRLLKTKDLPSFKVGKVWRFRPEDVEAWMKKGSVLQQASK